MVYLTCAGHCEIIHGLKWQQCALIYADVRSHLSGFSVIVRSIRALTWIMHHINTTSHRSNNYITLTVVLFLNYPGTISLLENTHLKGKIFINCLKILVEESLQSLKKWTTP